MLTKLATALLLGAGLTVVIPATASAQGCTGLCPVATGTVIVPGGNQTGTPGNPGPGGNTGPGVGCQGAQLGPGGICNNGAAPIVPVHIPTFEVAQTARDEVPVPTPQLHWAPYPRTYVGISTSLWLGAGEVRTYTATAQVADQAVTVTATPRDVTWNLGETTLTCADGGTPHGTTCAHTYHRSSADQPGGKYHITATITWTLAWICTGNCDANHPGLDPLVRTNAADLAVGEIQTGSTPG